MSRVEEPYTTGNRVGWLTLLAYIPGTRMVTPRTFPRWVCVCDCGTDVTTTPSNLRWGNTSSCGCRWKSSKKAARGKST